MKLRLIDVLTIAILSTAIVCGGVFTIVQAQQAPATAPTFGPGEAERVVRLGSRGNRSHDPSTIVMEKDDYWVFYTGRGTPSYRSKDLITWEAGPIIFSANPEWVNQFMATAPARRGGGGAGARGPASGPATAQAGGGGRGGGAMSFWAPDIIKVGDRYLLYYSVSVFGQNYSSIALVTNPVLDPNDPNYKWTDHGPVIQSQRGDRYNAIDPGVILDHEGRLWMSFGSFWSGIKMIEMDPKTGKRIAADSPMYSLAHNPDADRIEAPHIYRHGGHYYLFVNWGICCRGVQSTYEMRVGRSEKITGPYLDKDGKDLLQGGGSLLLATDGAFIGPGHAGVLKDGEKYWMSMHFYNGAATGRGGSGGTLAIRPLTWGADGWPVVENPKP